MSGETEKRTFPVMLTSKWFLLRDAFKRTIPGVVSEGYLATILRMKPASAKTNIIPTLRKVKLIDKEGKPTPLATKWRDDKEYKTVCESIIKACYPQELIDASPNIKGDKDAIQRWFASATSAGESAVSRMADFYIMLQQGVLGEGPTRATTHVPPAASSPGPKKVKSPAKPREAKGHAAKAPANDNPASSEPTIHINLQIHISPDASGDQIKDIFANIAKHIYNKT